jgi:HK97 family phage major capsid protein
VTNSRELRAKAAKLKAEAQEIYAKVDVDPTGRDFTDEELRDYDAKVAEAAALLNQADAAEEREKNFSDLDRRIGADPGRVSDPLPHVDPGNTRDGHHGYSLLKAIRQSDPSNKNERLDGLEAEVHQELLKERARAGLDREVRGALIPWDLPIDLEAARSFAARNGVERRDVTITTGAGALQTTVRTTLIELLRNKAIVFSLGARRLTGLVGTVVLPRQSGTTTMYWITEGNAPTESNPTIDNISLVPKTVGGFTDFSRKFLMQTGMDAEMFVREDLTTSLALEIDRVAINGSGSGAEPTGILQNSGITTLALGTNGAAPTWDAVVQLEEGVAVANADLGTLAYLTNSKVRSKLKRTQLFTGTNGMPIWDGDGELNGYRAAASQQVPSNLVKGTSGAVCSAIIFGDWSQLIVGFWSGVDVLVDPYTGGTAGNVRVVTLQDADVKVRHNESFQKIVDALTT